MKITRRIDAHKFIQSNKAIKPKRHRRTRRYITNNQANQICYADQLDKTTNNPYNFTYTDPDRSNGMSKVLKLHYDRMFHNYGVNLLYFRKYNTFFKEGKQNHANMVYGQDTTAEYFLSSYVRGYLNITKQDWQFNMMGYEAQQEIQIWFTIEEFRARFATVLGVVSADLFAVPVTADLINREYYGNIDVPQFYADIYGTLTDEQMNTLYLDHVYPQITQRPINSISYKTLVRVQPLNPLTGMLKGQLQLCKNDEFYATGYLKGQLMYHSLQNIENSPGWNLAPQVGDFFKLKDGEIQEDYEINQIIDKQMGGNDALNMFLRHYVYKCTAVRRMASEEQIHKPKKEIGSDKNQLFEHDTDPVFNTPQQEFKGAQFIKDKKDKKNIVNKKANKLATKIYNYEESEDNIYGRIWKFIGSKNTKSSFSKIISYLKNSLFFTSSLNSFKVFVSNK